MFVSVGKPHDDISKKLHYAMSVTVEMTTNEAQQPVFTCISCSIGFLTAEDQRKSTANLPIHPFPLKNAFQVSIIVRTTTAII